MCNKLKLLDKHKFKYIEKIGIELEGAWDAIPDFKVFSDGTVTAHGAIRGESHTDPKGTLPEVFDELEDKYPDSLNQSCGMHVHLSMPNMYYALLCTKGFWEYFTVRMGLLVDYVKKSGIIEDEERLVFRLEGYNATCAKEFYAEEQVRYTGKGNQRYKHLNFCYQLHGTMECRVLPMFIGISNAKMSICHLCWVIESFLDKQKKHEQYRMFIEVPKDSKDMVIKEDICV